MKARLREAGRRFWGHCTGPVTVRSIVFVAVIILFSWALFDRLAARDHNRAMQARFDLYSVEIQRGFSQIYRSWAKFDESQREILTNQRAMQDEISEQSAILKAERLLREKELARDNQKKTRSQSDPPGRKKHRPRATRKRPLRMCFRLEDRVKKFGNGAEVNQQILVSVPCP